MNKLISIDDLTVDQINDIVKIAKIYKDGKLIPTFNLNPVIGIMFFEPSTRTNYSFQTAIHKLGFKFIEYNHDNSSSKKGESLQDTISTFECYCDLIIIRHPDKNIFKNIVFSKPVINAGNGPEEHPTQALLDLFTILDSKDLSNNLKISFVGDIIYSRTIHSLIKLLEKYNNHYTHTNYTYNFVGYSELLDKHLEKSLNTKIYSELKSEDLNNLLEFQPDIIYTTRIQKERRNDVKIYNHNNWTCLSNDNRNDIVIDNDFLEKMSEDTILMHPLPRINEIHTSCDKNHRSVYYEQMKYGVYIRMAIIYKLLIMD
jgi:aspartate carbamoyltransferase catalytic subunit